MSKDHKLYVALLIDDEPIYMPYVIEKMLKNLDKSMQLKCVIARRVVIGEFQQNNKKRNRKFIRLL